jgi:virulence factor Mce-like protein
VSGWPSRPDAGEPGPAPAPSGAAAAPADRPHRTAKKKRRRGTQRDPLKVGIAFIVFLVLLTFFGFTKRIPFTPRWTLNANVANATQLRPGSPVRIAGVTVGEITAVSRGPGTTADIKMVISSQGRPIHSDATLKIRPRLFLEGSFYIQLDPGSPSAPRVGSGYTIPEPHTAAPVQFFTVLSTLNLSTRQSLIDALHGLAQGLSGGGAQGLHTATLELAPTLRDAAIVSQAAQGETPDDLSHLIDGAASVVHELGRHDAQLGDLIAGENQVAGALASEDGALSASIPAFDRTLQATPPALDAIDSSLAPLERFSRNVQPALRAAPPVLKAAAPALDQLKDLSQPSELPSLIGVLHPVVQVLPTLESELNTLLPKVTPVAQCLTSQVVPVLNSTLNDGALSTGEPVWMDLAHALANAAGEAQSFDADGYWARYLGLGQVGVSTGNIPGLGALTGSAPGPLIGARPLWNGTGGGPAFKPNQTCASQPAVNLNAASGSSDQRASGSVGTGGLTSSLLRSLVLHPPLRDRHVSEVVK